MTTRKERKGKASPPTSVADRPRFIEWLKDPENAAAYIEAVLEEGDPAGLLQALRNVAESRGGVSEIARRTGLNREALYRTLSKGGNPQLHSLAAILGATGLRLSVQPAEAKARKAA
ncbi:MAG: addiction module antidote protein [Pseudomonadota bacterium]